MRDIEDFLAWLGIAVLVIGVLAFLGIIVRGLMGYILLALSQIPS